MIEQKDKAEVKKIMEELMPQLLKDAIVRNRNLEDKIRDEIRDYFQSSGYLSRKLTSVPTDALEIVNRKYVTLNGTVANRPKSSVIGQRYFETSIGRPIYWNGSAWVDGAGSIS